MDYADLEWKAEDLRMRVEGINRWIMENPTTDPNLYEMVDCLMEFGNITSLYMDKISTDESAKGNKVSNYDIIKLANLDALASEIRKMMKLRGVIPLDKDENCEGFQLTEANNLGFRFVKSDFFSQNHEVGHLLEDIYYLAIIGSYPGEGKLGKDGFKTKKEVFSRIAGVSLYIWQESRNNVDFIYENRVEFEQMRAGLESLIQLFNEVGVYYYEGGDAVNNIFDSIVKHSKFNEKAEERGIQM